MTILTSQCDSVMKKMCEFIFPEVQKTSEPATDCSDVQIVFWICCTVIVLALFFVVGVLIRKWMEGRLVKKEREFKKEKEQEELKRKFQLEMVNKNLDFLDKQGNAENYQKALLYFTELVFQNKLETFSKETIEKFFKQGNNV